MTVIRIVRGVQRKGMVILMKMKDVCRKTGLSERTIRFYAEKGLICPSAETINGREYRNYSDQDVAELLVIADLRRAFFSIEEIKTMKSDPSSIGQVLEKYKQVQTAEMEQKRAVLQALDGVSSVRDVVELAERLQKVSAGLPLPQIDIKPNFGRMDQESREEKDRAYQAYRKRSENQMRRGRIMTYAIAAACVLLALLVCLQNPGFLNIALVPIQLIFSVLLCMGYGWVRWLFVVGCINSTISACFFLVYLPQAEAAAAIVISPWLYAHYGLAAVVNIASAVLLIFSKSVREFLYYQKNG